MQTNFRPKYEGNIEFCTHYTHPYFYDVTQRSQASSDFIGRPLITILSCTSNSVAEQTQSKSLQTRCLQTRLQTSLCALADMSAVFATFNHANTSVRPILHIGEY